MKRLIVDTNNLIFRVSAAHSKFNTNTDAEMSAGLAMHAALMSLRSHYNRIKPDQVALSFEGANNWRKAYTKSERQEVPVSRRLYKGNRVKDDSMIPFFELLAAFQNLVRNHTSLVCLSHPSLEGDDVIAAYAKTFSAAGDEVTVLSADKDFVQLLQLPNVRIANPDLKGPDRSLDKKTGEKIDPGYFMYEKAFRGDAGDNVLPAFPRVFAKRLKKAYDAKLKGDTYEHSNLMNSTWEFVDDAGEPRTMRVGDLFEENMTLMNLLGGQPADIQDLMTQTVESAVRTHGTFNLFQFQKFCGKFKLQRIGEEVSTFIPLFSNTGLNSPHKEEVKAAAAAKKAKAKTTLVF